MSHDVQIQFTKEKRCFITLEKAHAALLAVGFTEVTPVFWLAENPHTEVYLSVIADSGDTLEPTANQTPSEIDRIDTHVNWQEYRTGFKVAQHRRIALARQLDWVAYDLQNGQLIASPFDSQLTTFDALESPESMHNASIKMHVTQNGSSVQRRVKGSIVAKNNNDGHCRWFEKTPAGEYLCGLSTGYTSGQRALVLQFRDSSFNAFAEIEGVGSIGCVSPDGSRALFRGMTCDGYECRSGLLDVKKRVLVAHLPFVTPFIWESNNSFFAFPPRQCDWGKVSQTSSAGLAQPLTYSTEVEALIANDQKRLLHVDLNTGLVNVVQSETLTCSSDQDYRSIAIDQKREIIFLATRTSVAALNLKTGDFLWQKKLGRHDRDHFHTVNEIALSSCGQLLAVASHKESNSSANECVVLNCDTGEIVLAVALSVNSTITSVVWHELGWIACGLSNAQVVLLDINASMREFKAAQQGISTLRFEQGNLLVAGTEKQIRVFPLLPDENGDLPICSLPPVSKPSGQISSSMKPLPPKPLLTEQDTEAKELTLSLKKAQKIGADLVNCQNLESLILTGKGSLEKLTPYLGQLSSLRSLKIAANPQSLSAEIGELQGLTRLILNDCGMTSLPPEIGLLKNLQSFALVDNQITELPQNMKNMLSLQNLYLSRNKLSSVPDWVGELVALERLELEDNRLQGDLGHWGSLTSLAHVTLTDNAFSGALKVKGLDRLTKINFLHLGNRGMTALPEEIWHLTSLQRLKLKSIALGSIPEQVGNLAQLKYLSVLDAGLSSLPSRLFELKSLVGLGLSENPQLQLPESISKLVNLRNLWIENNNYDTLPESIKEMQSLGFVYVYGNNVRLLKRRYQVEGKPNFVSTTIG